MDWREQEAERIKQDEQSGRHARFPYVCPAGALTIGWGHNIDQSAGGPGMSLAVANFQLLEDMAECELDLKMIHPEFDTFTDARKGALVNVRFQLGPNKYRGFKQMIAAVNSGQWQEAARQLVDSKMGREQVARTARRARALETGC